MPVRAAVRKSTSASCRISPTALKTRARCPDVAVGRSNGHSARASRSSPCKPWTSRLSCAISSNSCSRLCTKASERPRGPALQLRALRAPPLCGRLRALLRAPLLQPVSGLPRPAAGPLEELPGTAPSTSGAPESDLGDAVPPLGPDPAPPLSCELQCLALRGGRRCAPVRRWVPVMLIAPSALLAVRAAVCDAWATSTAACRQRCAEEANKLRRRGMASALRSASSPPRV